MKLAEVAVLQQERNGLTAAAGPPLVPPREWFEREEPDEPTGWTVTSDGQVYGHAATWGSCHTGKPGRCVTPPKSRSNYAYYATGLTEVDDGELIPTGRITLGTGHASLTASPAATAEHYDNTGAVVADVTVRDGKHGIWVTGALRPDVTPERIRTLRGASLSGDWRSIRGALEMLGLLAVNVPGFPVPRAMALAASAQEERQEMYAEALESYDDVLALVGAGAVYEAPLDMTDEEYDNEFAALFEHAMTADGKISQRAKVARVMREMKAGRLKTKDGKKVTSRKQALAIAFSADGELEVPVMIEADEEFIDQIKLVKVEREEDDPREAESSEALTAVGPGWNPELHPRHPAGVREGGRFRVKGNDAGRFEVIGPNGKKVAEAIDQKDAQAAADSANEWESFWKKESPEGTPFATMANLTPDEDLQYLTPDELAETVDGISLDTGGRLWELTAELEREGKAAPLGGDRHDPYGEFGPPTVEDPQSQRDIIMSGRGNVLAVWDKLTPAQQAEINAAMRKRRDEWEGFLSSSAEPECEDCEEEHAVDTDQLPAARRAVKPEPRDGGVPAASLTASMRAQAVERGEAMPDGSWVIRSRGELQRAITHAPTQAEVCGHIATRAAELGVVGDLPASWDLDALTAAGFFDESKHPRHPKGVREGGRFKTLDAALRNAQDKARAAEKTLYVAPAGDGFTVTSEKAGASHAVKSGGAITTLNKPDPKLVEGPGGRMMSRTEQGVLMDKSEGRYVKSHSDLDPPSSEGLQFEQEEHTRIAEQDRPAGDAGRYAQMGVSDLAYEIEQEWSKQKGGVNFAAKPYLDAMKSLGSFDDSYGADSGKTVGLYFISNSAQFKGPKAKLLKAELKKRLGRK